MEGDAFGRSNPKYVGLVAAGSLLVYCAEEVCYLPEGMVPWNRQRGDGRASPVAPPVGLYIKRCRVCVKLKIKSLILNLK